jgi:hypothetical protein
MIPNSKVSFFSLALALGLAVSPVADAHHSFAMFDSAKEVVIEGTVHEFEWTSPHTWIHLDVMEDGKAVEFSIEGGSPSALERQGWNRASFKTGERVKVTVNPLRDGRRGGAFKRAAFADGRTLGQ